MHDQRWTPSDRPAWKATESHVTDSPRYTTHPKAVAGIVLMASLMLFSVLFTITFVMMMYASPIESELVGVTLFEPTLEDYFTFGRVFLSMSVGIVGTAGYWHLAGRFVS